MKVYYVGLQGLLGLSILFPAKGEEQEFFGKWSISKSMFTYIQKTLPQGSRIVELGSGWGSGQLSKSYQVWSIEHRSEWVGKYDTNYIHAPIVHRWYDVDVLKEQLPKEYDLLLIDGPAGGSKREAFLEHMNLFKLDVPIIVDDVQWKEERMLMNELAKRLNRTYQVHKAGRKKWGVILLNTAT